MKKISNHVNIPTLTELSYCCAGLSVSGRNPSSLTVVVFMIMAVDNMNGANSQSANAGDVKKLTTMLIF